MKTQELTVSRALINLRTQRQMLQLARSMYAYWRMQLSMANSCKDRQRASEALAQCNRARHNLRRAIQDTHASLSEYIQVKKYTRMFNAGHIVEINMVAAA